MDSKVIELCKKLKALSDRGVGGEKVNAEHMLSKLMEKHNLTIEDIEGEKKDFAYFKVDEVQVQIFWQVVYSVIGSGFESYKDKRKRGYKVLKLTASEAIEIDAKYNFFWILYKDELTIFREAFISKNNLYNPDSPIRQGDEFTKEEIDRLLRVQKMAMSIKKGNLLKQLK